MTPAVDAGAGTPDPLTHDQVSLEADVAAQRQRSRDAGMQTEPAQLVQDGPIADARAGIGELAALSQAGPDQVQAEQAAAIAQASGDMKALQAAAAQSLAQARAGTVQGTVALGQGVTTSEEAQRAQAGAEMQAVFARAQQSVDAALAPLAETALARWDAGVDRLASGFEASLSQVKQRIEARYATEDDDDYFDEIGAWFTRAGDAVFGLPDWVTESYDRAETGRQQAQAAAKLREKWHQRQQLAVDILRTKAGEIRALDPNANIIFAFRGSLASGKKFDDVKRNFVDFNPKSYDCDAFIVSDTLYQQAFGGDLPELPEEQKTSGYRDGTRKLKNIIATLTSQFNQQMASMGYRKNDFDIYIRSSSNYQQLLQVGEEIVQI